MNETYERMANEYAETIQKIDDRILDLNNQAKRTRDGILREQLYKRIACLESERRDMAITRHDILKFLEDKGGD